MNNKEEIKNFIKENLSIQIATVQKSFDGEYLKVSLFLEGEEISNDAIPLYHLKED
jgi:hypothetical protein